MNRAVHEVDLPKQASTINIQHLLRLRGSNGMSVFGLKLKYAWARSQQNPATSFLRNDRVPRLIAVQRCTVRISL